jgi:hypothetical protein
MRQLASLNHASLVKLDFRIGTFILRPSAGGQRKAEIKPAKILVPGTSDAKRFIK